MQARDAVRDDTATLDETGSVVDLNQAKVDENNARLKTQVTSTRSTLTLSLTTLTTHPHHPPSPLTTHHSPHNLHPNPNLTPTRWRACVAASAGRG
jgi:hypothetical protein